MILPLALILSTSILHHKGSDFVILDEQTEEISQTPLVSIGSNPSSREILLLDPLNAPLLEEHYHELLEISAGRTQESALLKESTRFIRERLFNPHLSSGEEVDAFVHTWISSQERTREDFTEVQEGILVPVIPLEAFIQARVGTCTHHALTAAYFIDRLMREGLLPQGTHHYIREEIHFRDLHGRHAWNLYLPDDHSALWHLDVQWGIIKNLKDPLDLISLYHIYGDSIINQEREHLDL
jgi:hypothetical protein